MVGWFGRQVKNKRCGVSRSKLEDWKLEGDDSIRLVIGEPLRLKNQDRGAKIATCHVAMHTGRPTSLVIIEC